MTSLAAESALSIDSRMFSTLDHVERLRRLAEETRSFAKQMNDANLRKAMLQMASSYDRLGKLAEYHAKGVSSVSGAATR